MKNQFLSILFIISLFPSESAAQERHHVSRMPEPVVLDGMPNEAAWASVEPLPYKMQMPNFGGPPSERCEVLLAYDNTYLYLAGRFFISDSSLYRPTTYQRDALDATTDFFGIIIDSYNDKENALGFFTTPTGMRWDGAVSNDAQAPPNEFPVNIDWNTFWDAAAARNSEGWFAELRIPWSSLRFQDDNGRVVMGMVSWWYLAAKNEVDMYPLIPLNWGDASSWKPSQMKEFEFEGVYSRKPLYIAPYLLGGVQQTTELDKEGKTYFRDDELVGELGLDLKYSLTSNLTLDLSANTDFAQVEADDQQVNLTRFSLFFPEKRLFFQERASIFDFNFEQFNRLFYSRRIGLDNDGNPVSIFGGARLVGRVGKFDLGFLNMQTAPSDSLNAENFNLLRLRKQVINPYSYVGGMLVNRMDFKGIYNTSYGLDGIFRLFGNDYLTAKWVQSFRDSVDNRFFSLNPSRIFLNWERRQINGFNYNFTFSRAGRDYLPEAGFELRENFTNLMSRLAYGWLFDETSKLLTFQVFLQGQRLHNNDSHAIETANLETGFTGVSKTGWGFQASGVYNREKVNEPFDLSDDVSVLEGDYDFLQLQGFVYSPFQYYFGVLAEVTAGGFFGGNLISVGLEPRMKLSNHLDLTGYYQYNYAHFRNTGQHFTAHVGRIKLLYMLNTRFSASAFIQYNSLEELFGGNVRLRYNHSEGNDLYIVYNDLINNRRSREIPALPFSSERSIVLKYTYTFRL